VRRAPAADSDERPLGITLLSGLYLFFFLVSASTYGNPFPFLGRIYTDMPAKALVVADCLICLYLFLGVIRRQRLTWYLLIAYNSFEIINTVVNVKFVSVAELEHLIGTPVNSDGLWVNNIAASLAILLLTQYIYRSKRLFSNRGYYLF
jgi:hypothetical protein